MVSSIINKISFLESCLNSLHWKLAEITANQCNKMVMICSFLENVAIKSFCVSIMFLLIDTIQKTTHITIVYEKKHSCFSRQKTKCSWFIGSFKSAGIWTTSTSKSNAVLRCAALKYSCWSRQILEPKPAYDSAVHRKKKNLFQMPVLTHFRKLLSGSAVLQSRASQCSISLWSAANPDSGFSPSPSFKVVKIGIWPYQYFSSSSVYSSSPLPCFPFLCPRKNTAIIAIFVAPALSELL